MALKLGKDATLKYKVGGVASGNPWVVINNIRDVTLNLEASEADVTTRGNNGWRATVAALKDGSAEFEMLWDTADAAFTAIKDAYLNNAAIGIAVLDDPGGSGQGLIADMMVTNLSRGEPLEEAITASVTVKPTYSTTAPSWTTTGTP